MEYHRITQIEDPLFASMQQLMQEVFPPEEVGSSVRLICIPIFVPDHA